MALIWGSKYMRAVFHDVRKARGIVSSHASNILGGISELKFYRSDHYASRTGDKVCSSFLESNLRPMSGMLVIMQLQSPYTLFFSHLLSLYFPIQKLRRRQSFWPSLISFSDQLIQSKASQEKLQIFKGPPPEL